MKKALATILFLSIAILGYSQGSFRYFSPDFKAIASSHRVIAILPFDVSLTMQHRIMKKIDSEEMHKLKISEGKAIQNSIEAFLLKHKSQKGYTVSFQETSKTNAILIQNEVTPFNIAKFSRSELAQILGVDGIIYGSVASSHLISNGASFLIGLSGFYPPPTHVGGLIINVADASDGKILWRYETSQESWIGSNQQTVLNNMLRRACRRFPYKRLP